MHSSYGSQCTPIKGPVLVAYIAVEIKVLRCGVISLACGASRSRFSEDMALVGQWDVGYSRLMMVTAANVALGLAACACADRPASFPKILH
jgi:hypothetical protein